jgi:hypothetical protein
MKKILSGIILAFVLLIAILTNPTKDKFVSWTKDQIKSQSNNSLVSLGIEVFGGSILNSVTSEQNYLFFTIFDTQISESKEVKVLGLFNHFITLTDGKNTSS